MRMNPVTNNKY